MAVYRSRFAPSPTGALHMGHAFAAITAYELAVTHGGEFLVRIEDIDQGRCRREYEDAIFTDLDWLGLSWNQPVWRQTEHLPDYQQALEQLDDRGLLYPCFCSRRDITAEVERSQGAPHGPQGALYPGSCRGLSWSEQRDRRQAGESFTLRLNMTKAIGQSSSDLAFFEENRGPNGEHGMIRAQPQTLGDVVLARKDIRTSYHLAVTVDDASQGVSCITRGRDLFFATHLHRLLQDLLELQVPSYHHHDLIKDASGRRLATRDRAESLASLRAKGLSVDELRRCLGLPPLVCPIV